MKHFKLSVVFFLALMILMSSCAGPETVQVPDRSGDTDFMDASPVDDAVATPESDDNPATEPPETAVHVHVFMDATCTESATCEQCGITEGSALGHDFTDATCTEPATCTRCGITEGSALGHDFTDATCTEPATCTRCGTTDGKALGHSYVGATCTDSGKCTRCGAKSSALGHNFAAATCTAPSTCKRCGATSGKALGHSYSGGKCKRCGDTHGPLTPEEAKLFKNKLTDEENAQALAVARKIVKQIEAEVPNGSDFDRIAMAASLVSDEYYKGVHLEKGNYYSTAYGVFVKRESSCAGCCRALGLVLSCMGYKWTHVNENQWTHQWVTVTVNGESIWADGQIGWAGTGAYPFA